MSLPNIVKYKQCISEKIQPLRPIRPTKTSCPFHPLRANCRAVKRRNPDDNDGDYIYHETTLSVVNLSYDASPHYQKLVNAADETRRGYYINAIEMYAYVHLAPLDDDEMFYGIDEAGERQLAVVTMVIKSIKAAFESDNQYVYLFAEGLQMDLVYSIFRAVVLPQRVVVLPFEDSAPVLENFNVMSVPVTKEAVDSQLIYRTFIIYNTVLSMILKQRNPFNEPLKSISLVLRTLGKCPNNKECVKCCDLRYGGNVPGHVMCAPRAALKRIFHYAKWARSPNNYKRYFELIVKPTATERQMARENAPGVYYNDTNYVLLNWWHFMENFYAYFGVSIQE
ncbi:VP1054 [Orgyia pseudotsugata single capsid nuclopolyhedrovirus]|nr:VP1054 [Orgyia pseudotsugata single capsid nuclopolyhedrovirus]